MKQFMKRSLALLLALIMLVGWMPQLSLPVAAAAEQSVVNYQTGDVSSTYKNVVKNWGTRGELATFLSPMAEEFYEEGFLEEMAALDGAASTEDVYESELYVYLQELMAANHKKNPSYDAIRDMFQYTDIEENGAKSSKISAFYSAKLVGPQWDGSTWTREHTWPNSKGGEGDRTHEHDILMLRPEAGNINGSRNNKAYGISEGFFDPNAQNDKVNVRGDVARIMLYTYVRWGGVTETAEDGTVSYPNKILQENMWGEAGVIESLEILLAWAAEDPVDTWEMARNDSVQSITGTRNVFVDYPELVFELFEAEIPEGYDTPSGSANDAAITVTAVVEGEGGAVSVNGEYVTVHPYAGYQVASVTGATHIKGDVYAVTSQEDCTVTVTFKKAANYMVNVWENGKRVSHAVVEDGNGFELPAFSGTVPEGHAFNGWVKAEAADSANKPTEIYEAGQDMIITGDSDFYALMTYLDPNDMSNPGKSWKLVTSTADLVLGDSYIIAGSNTAMAMSRVKKTNNRDGVTVTKAEDKSTLSFTDDVTVAELTLTEGIEIEVTEPETTVPNEDGTVDVYKLVTDTAKIKAGGQFVLAVLYNGKYYALDDAFGSAVTAVEVSGSNGIIDCSNSVPVLTVASSSTGISLSNGSKYLQGSSSTSLSASATAYQWNLTENSNGSYRLICNNATNRALAYSNTGVFKGYAVSNATNSSYAF